MEEFPDDDARAKTCRSGRIKQQTASKSVHLLVIHKHDNSIFNMADHKTACCVTFLSVLQKLSQMFDLCHKRWKYQGLCLAVLCYISMTKEVNIKLLELGEHPVFFLLAAPGYSRKD
jgi:hypothetical protein